MKVQNALNTPAKLKRYLLNGDLTKIANKTGYSTGHVSDVLNEKYSNLAILSEAYNFAQANRWNMIQAYLLRGDVAKIAKRTSFSPSYTSEVLTGKYFNEEIIDEAASVALENNAEYLFV